MGKVSKDMMNMLTEFLVCEIGSKAIDGITYTMITKDPKNKEVIERYREIRDEVTKCGFQPDEVYRVYELSNGYLFDMDLHTAKEITIKLAQAVSKTNGVSVSDCDLIGDSPEKRRKSDMIRLAKYIQQEYNAGKNIIEVALFSKNSVPHIVITGKNERGEVISEKYQAFAIRHWDVETINAKLLIPAGIRVSKIEPYEVLPSKTGVKFAMYLEKCSI